MLSERERGALPARIFLFLNFIGHSNFEFSTYRWASIFAGLLAMLIQQTNSRDSFNRLMVAIDRSYQVTNGSVMVP